MPASGSTRAKATPKTAQSASKQAATGQRAGGVGLPPSTLVANLERDTQQLRTELEALKDENKALKAENQTLKIKAAAEACSVRAAEQAPQRLRQENERLRAELAESAGRARRPALRLGRNTRQTLQFAVEDIQAAQRDLFWTLDEEGDLPEDVEEAMESLRMAVEGLELAIEE